MKILNLTPLIPYPLTEGGKVSQYATLDYLRKFNEITLILFAYSEIDIQYINTLKELWPEVDIETINFIVKTKVSVRKGLINIMKFILGGDKKHIASTNDSEFDNPGLTNFPVTKNRQFINELNKVILKKSYDIIQVDHITFIDLGYFLPKEVKKVFVHHEMVFGRLTSGLLNSDYNAYEKYILNSVKQTEANFLKQYDAVFVFSKSDKQKLIELEINKPVYNAPFPVLDENFVPINKTDTKIEKLIFLGGEDHAPNKDAINWYVNDIAPLIKEYSNIKLHIIGKWSKTSIKNFSNNSIYFSGFIDDIISYCKNSIMLVPVRTGSGIRTKILYAMAQGIPVISTSVGCEGILVEDNKSIIITNTASDFSDKIKKMLNDSELRHKLKTEAQVIAKENYSQKATGKLRIELYEKIISQNN